MQKNRRFYDFFSRKRCSSYYAIFRSEPIMTMSDLRQIGSHNNREKQAYNSNPDIKLELCKDNIELIPINTTYTKEFKEITKE